MCSCGELFQYFVLNVVRIHLDIIGVLMKSKALLV